jgi:O-acetyl-ADP-ribose deacetylase (regulator of RNase III)
MSPHVCGVELWLIHPDETMCRSFEHRFAGLPGVAIQRKRVEELDAHDCFVTAGNSFGIMTAGIDAAVVHFHGRALMERVQQRILDEYLGEQPVGTAFLIETGNERYPFLCHAPTMRVPGSIEGTDKVYCSTWSALLAVHQHNRAGRRPIRTVAIPAMGTGFGGVAYDEAARQMAAAYRHFLHPPKVLDWDVVVERHKLIAYDGESRRVK